MVKVDTYRLEKLFWSARTVVLDIERRERSNESLELLQEQTDVFLRSLHVIQKVLLEKHSKSNTVKLTCIPNNLPVSWARIDFISTPKLSNLPAFENKIFRSD